MTFPDGSVVEDDVHTTEPVITSMYGRRVLGHLVDGPWAEALLPFTGRRVHLVRTTRPGGTREKHPATLITDGSLDLLGQHLGSGPVDGRRFRMLIELAGGEAHEEDSWIGRRIELGETIMFVSKQVARCAITTQDPDSGARDLDTLRTIISYRGLRDGEERRFRRVRRGRARGPDPSRRGGPGPRSGRAKRVTTERDGHPASRTRRAFRRGGAGNARPTRGPQRVQRLRHRRAANDLREPRSPGPNRASCCRPGGCRAVVLCRCRHRVDARRDGARRRRQRTGRDGDGRHVRGDRHVPGAGHREGPRIGARRRHGAVRGVGPRDRRVRDPVRLHRDAARHPAGGHLAVRHREDRREPRAGAVPGRPSVRRDPCAADRARPRGGRGRGRGLDAAVEAAVRDVLAAARPLFGPRRRSSAEARASATDRRSGTRRA